MKKQDPLVRMLRYLDKRDNFVSEPEIEVDATCLRVFDEVLLER